MAELERVSLEKILNDLHGFVGEENRDVADECIKIYIGNYSPDMQYASSILLKMLLKGKYKSIMDEVKEYLGFRINDRSSSDVLNWKRAVKKAGACSVCGSKENLEAHHKVPWEYSITGRTDVDNGECLCEKCHKMMHNDLAWIEYMRRGRHG